MEETGALGENYPPLSSPGVCGQVLKLGGANTYTHKNHDIYQTIFNSFVIYMYFVLQHMDSRKNFQGHTIKKKFDFYHTHELKSYKIGERYNF